MLLSADDVRSAVLPRPPIGQRGYNEEQVDAFLDLVVGRLEGRNSLTAKDVEDVRFGKPRVFRRGYSEDEVDRLLARIARTLQALDQ